MNNLELLPCWLVPLYVLLFGLCIGSFLNVVVLRGLSGESFVFERSKCPKCNNQLKWYMNIPLLSYIFLRGKCAFCKCNISIQYPIVEFITALLFLAVYFAFGLSFKALFMCIFFALFIAMSTTDFIETVIIDTHAYILLAFALLYSYLGLGDVGFIQALLGAGFGFLVFEIMARIGKFLCGVRMFGEGDSLIALGLGAIFGWKSLIIVIVLSILIQSISAIPLLIKLSFAQEKNRLAFSYIIVVLSVVILFLLNHFHINERQITYSGFVILISSGLLWALRNIIVEIKNKKDDDTKNEEEKFCLMPFGPALLISSTICVFYLPQIKVYILNFFQLA